MHEILSKHQSGFSRAMHSTVTALLEGTDTRVYNIDHGKINAVVFLDLKKGFRHIRSLDPIVKIKPLWEWRCLPMA